MDYKKEYEEKLSKAITLHKLAAETNNDNTRMALEELYPELKESEEEKIRNEIISFLKEGEPYYSPNTVRRQKWANWLEKQGMQNPEIKDDVLSRFAFYQYDDDTIYLSSLFVRESDRKCGYGSKILKAAEEVAKTFGISKIRLKVESNTWMEEWYKKNGYEYLSSEGEYDWLEKQVEQTITDKGEPKFEIEKGKWYVCNTPRYRDFVVGKAYYCPKNGRLKPNENEMARYVARHCFHLWTIQDAKDGDVLAVNDDTIIIFKNLYNGSTFHSSCHIENDIFRISKEDMPDWWSCKGFHPSTKEQRNLLFTKMKEAGYEWDAEKKELKKIEQKPVVIIPKFHEGDVIKPKDGGHEPWKIMQVDISDKKYRFKDGYVIHFGE